MVRRKVSLETITAQSVASQATSEDNVVMLSRDDATTSKRSNHTSLYLSPGVRKAIRDIAYQLDRKPHDLYMEGIDLMLARYGKPSSKELSKNDVTTR
jgi:hypothetical protein